MIRQTRRQAAKTTLAFKQQLLAVPPHPANAAIGSNPFLSVPTVELVGPSTTAAAGNSGGAGGPAGAGAGAAGAGAAGAGAAAGDKEEAGGRAGVAGDGAGGSGAGAAGAGLAKEVVYPASTAFEPVVGPVPMDEGGPGAGGGGEDRRREMDTTVKWQQVQDAPSGERSSGQQAACLATAGIRKQVLCMAVRFLKVAGASLPTAPSPVFPSHTAPSPCSQALPLPRYPPRPPASRPGTYSWGTPMPHTQHHTPAASPASPLTPPPTSLPNHECNPLSRPVLTHRLLGPGPARRLHIGPGHTCAAAGPGLCSEAGGGGRLCGPSRGGKPRPALRHRALARQQVREGLEGPWCCVGCF